MIFYRGRSKKENRTPGRNILSAISPESAYAEAFRTLRTNLHFSGIDNPVSSIMITSALQSEGKTNTAVNLGYTIAKTGKKVLLVDADLRKPLLTDIFNLRGNPGLTDLVVDTLDKPVLTGDLGEYSPGDLIFLIRHQNLTGTLRLVSGENEITFYFRDGTTIDAVWNTRSSDDALLQPLVSEKILDNAQAEAARRRRKKTGQRMGHILLTMGLITKPDLEKKLAIHAAEAVRMASAISKGTFSFSGAGTPEMSPLPALNFDILYGESFKKAEDLVFINQAIDTALHKTKTANLWVLGSGKIPPNPSEIINSDRTGLMADLLKQKFDFIIFDTSPVLPASDAMLMAPRADGTIIVVRSGHSNKKLVKRVTTRFKQSNLPVLGVVLNRVTEKNQDYYYRYYREYKN